MGPNATMCRCDLLVSAVWGIVGSMRSTPPPAVDERGLDWWLELAGQLEWTWAKTYAHSAPHHYVVLGRTSGLTRSDFVRAGAVIRTFGQPGKFYGSTNIYLKAVDWKWWTMDPRVVDTDLINRAQRTDVYGAQDAPHTATGRFTEYDSIAADYDLRRDTSLDAALQAEVERFFGGQSPTMLDVGCGVGSLVNSGVVQPERYTGVDSSQGMLNGLVLRHPAVHRVVPAPFEDVSDDALGGPFDLVLAMDLPGVDVERLRRLCRGLLVTGPPVVAKRCP